MHDDHAIRDVTVFQIPGQAMRSPKLSLMPPSSVTLRVPVTVVLNAIGHVGSHSNESRVPHRVQFWEPAVHGA